MGAHPNLALGLNNLALLHFERGAYLEAQTLLRRALAIEEEAYGPDHPALIVTLENYARVARELGREAEADELDAGRRRSQAAPSSIGPRLIAPGDARCPRRTPWPPRRGYPPRGRRGPRLLERYRSGANVLRLLPVDLQRLHALVPRHHARWSHRVVDVALHLARHALVLGPSAQILDGHPVEAPHWFPVRCWTRTDRSRAVQFRGRGRKLLCGHSLDAAHHPDHVGDAHPAPLPRQADSRRGSAHPRRMPARTSCCMTCSR